MLQEGVVTSYGFVLSCNEYPKIHGYRIRGSVATDNGLVSIRARSCELPGISLNIVYAKALGEFIERVSMVLPAQSSRWFPRIQSATPPWSYDAIPRISPAQREQGVPIISSAEELKSIACVQAYNEVACAHEPVPLTSIFTRSDHIPGARNIAQSTSSGCGGGITEDEAWLSAVCEAIERDRYLLWWFSGMMPVLRIPRIGTELSQLVADARRHMLEVYFVDTGYDMGVIACVCVLIDPTHSLISFGSRAGLSEQCYIDAYREALAQLCGIRTMIREGATPRFKAQTKHAFTDASLGQSEREVFYCTAEGIAYIRRTWLAGTQKIIDSTPVNYTAHAARLLLVERFTLKVKECGPVATLYTFNLRSDLTQRFSYHVVRAFVPEFMKLHLLEHLATPDAARLKAFMRAHGEEYDIRRIRVFPHPLP